MKIQYASEKSHFRCLKVGINLIFKKRVVGWDHTLFYCRTIGKFLLYKDF